MKLGNLSLQTRFVGSVAATIVAVVGAGVTGRGFAVVADEVRKLSERTARSAKEISDMVVSIQETTSLAIDGIESGANMVNASVAHAETAGNSMQQIARAAQQVQTTIGEISSALREQTTASEVIANSVEQLAGMNEEISMSVKNMHDDAQHLSKLANDLQNAVNTFKL